MKETTVKIGLLNHIGGGNLGDDATFDAVMQNIRIRWPHAEIHALTMNPEDTKLRHGVPSYPIRRQTWSISCNPPIRETTSKRILRSALSRFKPLFWLAKHVYALIFRLPMTFISELRFLFASRRVIRRFDLLVISGGGQLTERDGPWAFPYTILKWVLLSKSSNVKCIFLNLGAGPLSHPLSKSFAKRALTTAQYVSFRDRESQTLAREIGFVGRSCVFPDSVYSLRCPSFEASGPNAPARGTIGFAAVPFGDPRLHPGVKDSLVYDRFLNKCRTISAWLIAQGYLVTLFGTDISVDPLVIRDILTGLEEQQASSLPSYAEVGSIGNLLTTMSGMDYVITCRFHGVIFAHLLNKPVLAIAHHPKVAHLMDALGLSEYCVDITTFDPNLVADTFEALVRDRDEIKDRMAASLARYRLLLKGQLDDLFPANMNQASALLRARYEGRV
jgi:polysaccharide pyruvyl transferase WcaK-like protein